jgi:phosphatidylserine decarboxylase
MKTILDAVEISETKNDLTEVSKSNDVIKSLIEKAKHDKGFSELLKASLCQAKLIAKKQLKQDLYDALKWPIDLVEYSEYLVELAKWMPEESNKDVWKLPGTTGHQEVDDRLGHFHWLINQKVGNNNTTIVQNMTWFSEWLIEYAKCWGSFLDTTESFNQEKLDTFMKNSPKYRVQDSMINGKPNNPSGWLTFNQFFARELNPGLRSIASPFDNRTVTSPADCTFRAKYNIGANSSIPEIIIKNDS